MQKETMKKISTDYKSVDKMNARQNQQSKAATGKHLSNAAKTW